MCAALQADSVVTIRTRKVMTNRLLARKQMVSSALVGVMRSFSLSLRKA